jgi:hypothetical protein
MACRLRQRGGRSDPALSFSDGILRVEVADAGWRRELAKSGAALCGFDQQVFRHSGEAD